VSRILRFPHI